jgi:hypothetical protein
MRQPLMKVKAGQGDAARGVDKAMASGARSCVIKVGDDWFRLKGCGMRDQGFTVKTDHGTNGAAPTRQIRGSVRPKVTVALHCSGE